MTGPVARFQAGEISAEIALAQLLLTGTVPDPATLPDPVATLARAHADRLAPLAALARAGFDPPGEDQVAATAALFDRLAVTAPEAAVAFYTLGDPALLDAATAELAAVIGRWVPLAGASLLDWGCGIGRVAAALAPRAGDILGVDLSAGMIAEARRRCAGLANVRFRVTDGGPLHLTDGSVDAVLAVDSLPFLVRSGPAAVDRQVAEFARTLRPGGHLLIFNWSYRNDPAADRAEAQALADAHGLALDRAGEQPFAIWDGTGFLFTRR